MSKLVFKAKRLPLSCTETNDAVKFLKSKKLKPKTAELFNYFQVEVVINDRVFIYIPVSRKFRMKLYRGIMTFRESKSLEDFLCQATKLSADTNSNKPTEKQIDLIIRLSNEQGVGIEISDIKSKRKACEIIKALINKVFLDEPDQDEELPRNVFLIRPRS